MVQEAPSVNFLNAKNTMRGILLLYLIPYYHDAVPLQRHRNNEATHD